jgi:hypothetical protein
MIKIKTCFSFLENICLHFRVELSFLSTETSMGWIPAMLFVRPLISSLEDFSLTMHPDPQTDIIWIPLIYLDYESLTIPLFLSLPMNLDILETLGKVVNTMLSTHSSISLTNLWDKDEELEAGILPVHRMGGCLTFTLFKIEYFVLSPHMTSRFIPGLLYLYSFSEIEGYNASVLSKTVCFALNFVFLCSTPLRG